MRQLMALIHVRNLEFIRDRSALAWNIVLPVLLVAAFSLAFSGAGQPAYKIGLLSGSANQHWQAFRQVQHLEFLDYEDQDDAMGRLGRHQVDLLLGEDGHHYWVNPNSSSSYLAEQLLRGVEDAESLQREEVTGHDIRYVDWVLPGILGMNIMFSSLFGVGYVVVRYRKMGVLKRLQATPLRPFTFLTAQLLSRLLLTLTISVAVFLGCDLVLDFIMIGSGWLLFLITLLGCTSMIALGSLVASVVSSEEFASGLLNLLAWPMMLFSNVWFSMEGAPRWMQISSEFFPLTHLVKGAREIMLEGAGLEQVGWRLVMLAAFTLCYLALGARFFRWQR